MWLYNLIGVLYIFNPVSVLGMDMILANLQNTIKAESVVCTSALIRKYLTTDIPLSGFILSIKVPSTNIEMFEKILYSLHNEQEYSCTIVLLGPSFFKNPTTYRILSPEKPVAYFMINDVSDDLRDDVEIYQSLSNWNPNAQFILLFTNDITDTDEFEEIFLDVVSSSFRTLKIYNIFGISAILESDFVYGWTFFPYHSHNGCGHNIQNIQKIDMCQEIGTNITDTSERPAIGTISEIKSSRFIDKFPNNLNGCPLTVAFRPLEPYIFEDTTKNCSTKQCPLQIRGLEYKLLQCIGDVLNLNIVYLQKEKHIFFLYQMLIDG